MYLIKRTNRSVFMTKYKILQIKVNFLTTNYVIFQKITDPKISQKNVLDNFSMKLNDINLWVEIVPSLSSCVLLCQF